METVLEVYVLPKGWQHVHICAWCFPNFHVGTHGTCETHCRKTMSGVVSAEEIDKAMDLVFGRK